MAMARSATTFQKGDKGNPKGRKPKTELERSAEEFLAQKTPHSAERLIACADRAFEDGDYKTAGGLYAQHLKFSLGETVRSEVNDVTERAPSPLEQLTLGELRALIAAQRKGGA